MNKVTRLETFGPVELMGVVLYGNPASVQLHDAWVHFGKEKPMLPVEEKNDVNPICPHCGKELMKIWCRGVESVFGKRYIYFCPECKKVLGVSHRKGFWMG